MMRTSGQAIFKKGVRQMKRTISTLTIMLGVAVLVATFSSPASAVVTGQCSNCHTMHNSQGGSPMNFDGTTTTPTQTLLRGTCLQCHSDTTTSEWKDSTTGAPIVYNSGGAPTYGWNSNTEGLAAGNFYYCDVVGESVFGHNVSMVNNTAADSDLGTDSPVPPGFVQATKPTAFNNPLQAATDWGPATWDASGQVTCAGTYGCHGNRATAYDDSYKGIKGAHHTDDTTIDGSRVGKSYRFLAGIIGVELNTSGYEWERVADSTHHNGYKGDDSYGNSSTISYLCGECHGNFHAHASLGGTGQVGSGSPWLRHPTDIDLDASTNGIFTTDYTSYSVETPVALETPSTSTSTVDTTSEVICLSCHRAHASPHTDILRFQYSTMDAGGSGTTGCLRCHERQR